jgi:hypothetical protein
MMNTHYTCEKSSLHFNYLKTADMSRLQYDVTCMRYGLLYSHSDTMCLLIKLNFIELQPSVNILIWVA